MTEDPTDKVEAARLALVRQMEHVSRIYGNAGHKVMEEEAYQFLITLTRDVDRLIKEGRLPAGYSDKLHSLMHGLGGSHMWLREQQRIQEDLRNKWMTLRARRGTFISPHARPFAPADVDKLE